MDKKIIQSIFTAVGEPPMCMSCSALFAVKRAIEDARSDAGIKDFFPLCEHRVLGGIIINYFLFQLDLQYLRLFIALALWIHKPFIFEFITQTFIFEFLFACILNYYAMTSQLGVLLRTCAVLRER